MPPEVFLELVDMITPVWDDIRTGISTAKKKMKRSLKCLMQADGFDGYIGNPYVHNGMSGL